MQTRANPPRSAHGTLNASQHWLPLATPLILLACLFVLQGCAGIAAIGLRPSARQMPLNLKTTIRTLEADHRFCDVPVTTVAARLRARYSGEALNILALSGGGAAGAFGAGAVAGLTRSGSRPDFAVVTGVSAGALVAPYAFLGSDWDSHLLDAFSGRTTANLLQPRGLGAIFGSSFYRGMPLKQLIDSYATAEMIQAVAREENKGRLLLVATHDVAAGKVVVWDLGAIASNGGSSAQTLFREVLLASASVPGIFPPATIHVRNGEASYSEVHADAAAAVPFFVPSVFAQTSPGSADGGPRTAVYVIIDRPLGETGRSSLTAAPAKGSLTPLAGLNHRLLTTLELTATRTELQGATLRYSAISGKYPHINPLDFHADTMRSLFGYAYDCAQQGRLWTAFQRNAENTPTERIMTQMRDVPCPADDAVIGYVASR